jgi:hypothetical protein
MSFPPESEVDWIHYRSSAADIASVADFEVMETYDQHVEHYRENDYSYVPLPYSEKYYDVAEDELEALNEGQVVSTDTNLITVLKKLTRHPFLFYDSYGKRVLDQPAGESLPYRYESGTLTVGDTVYGPRQVYDEYEALRETVAEDDRGLLLGLAQERHRYFILTLPDTNKRPVRTLFYRLLMQLETRFGDLLRTEYTSEELLSDVNPRALGQWKKNEIDGNKTHIVEHLTLGELKHLVGQNSALTRKCGFESSDELHGSLHCLSELRNKVMHPTSTLIRDTDDLRKYVDTVDSLGDVLETLMKNEKQEFDLPYSEDVQIPEEFV